MKKGICDKCGSPLPLGTQFCPQCADPVTDADFADVSGKKVSPKIEIEFNFSSSKSYERAVKYASKFPSYTTSESGKDQSHYVAFQFVDVEAAVTLWDMVSNWKNTQLLIVGQKSGKKQLNSGPLGCYRERQISNDPMGYCAETDDDDENFWDCFKLGMGGTTIFSSWEETYCNSNQDGHITVNKKKIAEDLTRKAKDYQICPAFNPKKIKKTFSELPKEIDVLSYSGRFKKYLKNVKEEIGPTKRQWAYAERLGLHIPSNATKTQVSDMIDAHLNEDTTIFVGEGFKEEKSKKNTGGSIGGIIVLIIIVYVLWRLFI
jgi:hypothetical protein